MVLALVGLSILSGCIKLKPEIECRSANDCILTTINSKVNCEPKDSAKGELYIPPATDVVAMPAIPYSCWCDDKSNCRLAQ